MAYRFAFIVVLALMISGTIQPAHALDARGSTGGDPYFTERQALCPSPDATLRGCFTNNLPESRNPPPGQRGLACVYFPCTPGQRVVICDPSNRGNQCQGGIGEYPSDMNDTYGQCRGCETLQCDEARRILRYNHEQYERAVMVTVSEELRKHRLWLANTFFKDQILPALAMMTEQLSAVGMHQVMIIGQFFDAKMQLETQRQLQVLKITAHQDYRPSESFCTFGTIGKSLQNSEEQAKIIPPVLAAMQMTRELRNNGMRTSPRTMTKNADMRSRWDRFKDTYCTPHDNGRDFNEPDTTGLAYVCGNTTQDPERVNRDLNYAALINEPRTIDANFIGGSDEKGEDILALSYNLYGHDIQDDLITPALLKTQDGLQKYMDLRTIKAKRGIAQHSFNSIVALKSPGTDESYDFLINTMEELGMSENDAEALITENPSYYAQLEILSKKMFQRPQFFTKTYDTPANVKRKYAAMLAIERILDHEISESMMRQEMLMSVLLSSKLREDAVNIERKLGRKGK